MGPFRGPYRGSPLWEEMLMGPFRGGTHKDGNGNSSNVKRRNMNMTVIQLSDHPNSNMMRTGDLRKTNTRPK